MYAFSLNLEVERCTATQTINYDAEN